MGEKDIVMISRKELKRLHVVKQVVGKGLKQREAAEILGVSCRQVRRIVKRIKTGGEGEIVHKGRGRPSNWRKPQEMKERAIQLYCSKYKGFGPSFAAEKLSEVHAIQLSDETLRLWLMEKGYWKKSRKSRGHRKWRERKAYFGEMVQMDGSHHNWLEGRGPECVLMGYSDDATGTVYCRFYPYEGTMPAMESFRYYIRKYGIPMSLYLDKHTTYKSPAKQTIEDQLNDREPMSQFERAMRDLGVEVIHAHSPQAKGRIERLFKTLQDRLVKEMRLKGIKTIEEANEFLKCYLPRYNKKFAVAPANAGNLHMKVPKGLKLQDILCVRTERTLRNDFTIAHKKRLYQITDNVNAKKVVVQENTNGSMFIIHNGIRLKYKEITTHTEKKLKKSEIDRPIRKYIPPPDHPWRNSKISSPRRRQSIGTTSL